MRIVLRLETTLASVPMAGTVWINGLVERVF